ncbi:MAG TPA: FAD:protein FMN transferase [Thermoleophilaceae bacterium]
MSEHDLTFRAMGSEIRLLIGDPVEPGLPSPAEAAARACDFVHAFDERLSRFRGDSELCALNADARDAVPASPLLCSAVAAGVWAAERSGGLVDPTLVGPIEAIGYRESRKDATPAPLGEALPCAPVRAPAQPDPHSRWSEIRVDAAAGMIRRPAGVRFDTGGAGKGLCADAIAHTLAGYSRFVVDCGGDMRIGGPDAARVPYHVEIEHPFTRECAATIPVGSGGVATSGINTRVWRMPDGSYAHHLLNPATGRPAWTGLVTATALADTTLEAETLAKTALLLGPSGARRVLRDRGGAIVHDDGRVELIGPLQRTPLLHVRVSPPRTQAVAA